ncbi:MAG: metalloregulator ArsR/SmtB family transcription factor [Anaerolineales bacterium]|nr:metalloregulator ArsR/SmtB family transcription factor [Anaerolineales bacterium]
MDSLDFVKALSDANRLKMLGLLAQRPYSGEELAALLDLKPSTVSHHLSKLAEAGLVSARAEGYYSVYELDRNALEATTRDLFSGERMAAAAAGVDADAYDHKIISDYSLPDGRLKTIPAQRQGREKGDAQHAQGHVAEAVAGLLDIAGLVTGLSVCLPRKTPSTTRLRNQACKMTSSPPSQPSRMVNARAGRSERARLRRRRNMRQL